MESLNLETIVKEFPFELTTNRRKAEQKKEEYLERIMQIFRDFVSKCQQQIDKIIEKKLNKLEGNYELVREYLQNQEASNSEQAHIVVSEFLMKPFEKFPFSGNKNQKAFKEQYSLIEKASVLIEQTLVDSFNEQQIPNFQNHKFFETLQRHGVGSQSLTKLSVLPQNLRVQPLQELVPLQKNVKSLKMTEQYLVLIGTEPFIEIWDLEERQCHKKLYLEVLAEISYLIMVTIDDLRCLTIGFGDQNPEIWLYRTDNWARYGCSVTHTRCITTLVQVGDLLLSGGVDGKVCIHTLQPFRNIHSCLHISSIQDIIVKNNLVYVLLKCSSLCQYQLQQNDNELTMQFRRTLSTGFISMIRYTEVGGNFTGVACHIYGLSQIQITRKFKVEETNIINVSQMIADFVVIESKQTSEYFAVCGFQNSSAVRIYSLKSGEAIFEVMSDYLGQVGVAGYLPKVEIAWVNGHYWILMINQSEFQAGSSVRVYQLTL